MVKRENAPERKTKFSQIHYDYIFDQGVMDMQVGKSLAMRAADFMRVFPAKKMSSSRLQRIYKEKKIRFKKVKITKILTTRQRLKIKRYVPNVQADV